MKQGQTAPYISGEAPEGMYGEATALSRHMIRKHLHQCYKQAVKSTEPRKDWAKSNPVRITADFLLEIRNKKEEAEWKTSSP